MTLPDLQRTVFARVGVQLLAFQSVEKMLRLCMQVVLPVEPIKKVEHLHALEERERKKTLGYFMAALRSRVTVDTTFDAALAIFLDDRNAFVHDIHQFTDWNPQTAEGCAACQRLLDLLDRRTQIVLNAFSGLLRSWELQNGNPITLQEHEAEFARIEQECVPLANLFFAPKSDA